MDVRHIQNWAHLKNETSVWEIISCPLRCFFFPRLIDGTPFRRTELKLPTQDIIVTANNLLRHQSMCLSEPSPKIKREISLL